MTQRNVSTAIPFAAACLGIAFFSMMDAAMKGLSIAIGAYNTMLWRVLIGVALCAIPYFATRKIWPSRAGLRVHFLRGAVNGIMAVTFCYGIARVPLAEGIALSFIAPLIALYLAAALLGETVGRKSVVGSLLGIVGVGVILASRATGQFSPGSGWGVAAILVSAIFYAYSIVLMRQQALLALPVEVAFFQNLTTSLWLLLLAPFFAFVPSVQHLPMLALSAGLATCSLLLLSWAYARAEAQVLVPVEYTAFIWAAIMGAVFYDERLTAATVGGTVLIVIGCVVASRAKRTALSPTEAAI
ncbi:MAG: DMT family transporter [Sphingomonadales bacterium]